MKSGLITSSEKFTFTLFLYYFTTLISFELLKNIGYRYLTPERVSEVKMFSTILVYTSKTRGIKRFILIRSSNFVYILISCFVS